MYFPYESPVKKHENPMIQVGVMLMVSSTWMQMEMESKASVTKHDLLTMGQWVDLIMVDE